jgi:four helix bundle protein
MDKFELEKRTRRFALRIITFVATLPRNKVADVLGYQLMKAGTSMGANYHEANRAESRNDFIHKIGIVEKEAAVENWLPYLRSPGGLQKRADVVIPIRDLKFAIFS